MYVGFMKKIGKWVNSFSICLSYILTNFFVLKTEKNNLLFYYFSTEQVSVFKLFIVTLQLYNSSYERLFIEIKLG